MLAFLPTTEASLTPTAVALLGDAPELGRESRIGDIGCGGKRVVDGAGVGLWECGDRLGNSQGWRLKWGLKEFGVIVSLGSHLGY